MHAIQLSFGGSLPGTRDMAMTSERGKRAPRIGLFCGMLVLVTCPACAWRYERPYVIPWTLEQRVPQHHAYRMTKNNLRSASILGYVSSIELILQLY